MDNFKGTKGKWSVKHLDDIFIENEFGEQICEMPAKGIIKYETWRENALIISKAPEMLIELHETVIDLKILRNQIADASKTNHLFIGMPELMDNWIERKQQLIKEATEL